MVLRKNGENGFKKLDRPGELLQFESNNQYLMNFRYFRYFRSYNVGNHTAFHLINYETGCKETRVICATADEVSGARII